MGLRSHESGKGRGLPYSQRGVGRRVGACAAEAQGSPLCPAGAVNMPWWLKGRSCGPRLHLSLFSRSMCATRRDPGCQDDVVTPLRPLSRCRKRIEKAKKEAKKAEKKRKREEKKAKKAAKKAAQKAEEEAKRAEKERKVGPRRGGGSVRPGWNPISISTRSSGQAWSVCSCAAVAVPSDLMILLSRPLNLRANVHRSGAQLSLQISSCRHVSWSAPAGRAKTLRLWQGLLPRRGRGTRAVPASRRQR